MALFTKRKFWTDEIETYRHLKKTTAAQFEPQINSRPTLSLSLLLQCNSNEVFTQRKGQSKQASNPTSFATIATTFTALKYPESRSPKNMFYKRQAPCHFSTLSIIIIKFLTI